MELIEIDYSRSSAVDRAIAELHKSLRAAIKEYSKEFPKLSAEERKQNRKDSYNKMLLSGEISPNEYRVLTSRLNDE